MAGCSTFSLKADSVWNSQINTCYLQLCYDVLMVISPHALTHTTTRACSSSHWLWSWPWLKWCQLQFKASTTSSTDSWVSPSVSSKGHRGNKASPLPALMLTSCSVSCPGGFPSEFVLGHSTALLFSKTLWCGYNECKKSLSSFTTPEHVTTLEIF